MSETNEIQVITFCSLLDMKFLLSATRSQIKFYEFILLTESDESITNKILDKIVRARNIELALTSRINRIKMSEES